MAGSSGRPDRYHALVSESPPREALVLRFPPGGKDEVKKIQDEAKYVNRHHQKVRAEPWFRLSIWADVPREGETAADLMTRLVGAAGMGRIRIADERNAAFWWTTAASLYDAGFEIRKDGRDGEPEEHYSVVLGTEASREVVGRFVQAFLGPEQTGQYLP
jgi:hypothetical protein